MTGWQVATCSYAESALAHVLAKQVDHLLNCLSDEQLASASACGDLLDQLLAFDLDCADEATLVETVAAANRLAASATAVMTRAAGILAERDQMNSPELAAYACTPDGEDPTAGCTAADELAPRLGWTRRATRDLTRRGQALSTYLQSTGDAMSSGLIDTGRANALVDSLQHVSWQVAMAVEDQVLPRAPYRTAGQLRRDVAAAIVAVDPAEAERRAEAVRRERRVSRPRALPDETAALTIEGPATDVVGLDLALDAAARRARAEGDARTTGQLRFDLLASQGSSALASGRWRLIDGELPLAQVSGRRPEIHVTVPLDHLLPDSARADDVTPGPRHESVPSLTGYGPITPCTARALAAGGVWRRLVTDPLSDELLDLGHQRYRPSTALADHVRARDRTCVRPGCSTPARETQLDHTVPWAADGAGGGTDADNLGPLCERDHQVKTHGDFHVTQPEPGVFEWRTPTGHRYRRELDGSVTALNFLGRDRPPPF